MIELRFPPASESYMERLIENASRAWPLTTNSRRSQGKVKCPTCGATGWPKGSWTHAHLEHTTCHCGKIVSVRGLKPHQAKHSPKRQQKESS